MAWTRVCVGVGMGMGVDLFVLSCFVSVME
jgi:hypothetical protein